jgi:putative tricarboxylic transport membrane protein
MSRLPDDRRWALALAVLGLTVGATAVGFRVAFVTDPLGPRAFPWLAAALFCAAAFGLWVRPGPDGTWPAAGSRKRLTGVMLSLVAWSILMPVLGFVPSTTVEVAFLGRLFGARPLPGLAAGLALSTALWILFGFALGLPLPIGVWS